MSAIFGPAGRPDSFEAMGYRKTEQIPDYLQQFDLTAFEYQFGRGVRYTENALSAFAAKATAVGIVLSVHSPYYISLSSVEEEKRLNSITYITDSAKAARLMGADRIVVHSGSCGKISREEALLLAKDTLAQAIRELDELGLGDITLCPETMGKLNQLGNFDEVMQLCEAEERLLPCIDFGHLNARTLGGIRGKEDYRRLLDEMENRLGYDRASRFHSHFSKIQYTEKGGEKMHLTFADMLYGPDFEPLMELIAQKGWSPRFICESAGTQAEDAKKMKNAYDTAQSGGNIL
ncbi:MAG: TIM barrel protein [Candidatus Merdivicinus sp.]